MSSAADLSRTSPTKLTYREYVLFPSDGNRHEIINGRHHMNPAPNPRHQFVSRHIQFQLMEQIEQKGFGQVIDAPIDVQFSDCDVVQPDIVVILKANRVITPIKIKGVPDLVIEVLSPSNRKHDITLKRQLYEQAGVPEYWIVDPDEQVIHQLRLSADGRFGEPAVCSDMIRFETALCSALVELARVWESP